VENGGKAEREFVRGRVDARVQVIENVEDVHSALVDAATRGEFGRYFREQACPLQKPKSDRGKRREKYLLQLVAYPLGRDHAEAFDGGTDGGQRAGVDVEGELGGETDGAQGPEAVLAEALERVAHGAHEAPREVLAAAVGVDEQLGRKIEGHRVDSEVPAREILLDGRGELDGSGVPAVDVARFGPEGRDLDLQALEKDGDRAVLDARRDDPPVGSDDFFRPRVRGGVEVAHLSAEEIVANGAAH
jgi:hypothetical protein